MCDGARVLALELATVLIMSHERALDESDDLCHHSRQSRTFVCRAGLDWALRMNRGAFVALSAPSPPCLSKGQTDPGQHWSSERTRGASAGRANNSLLVCHKHAPASLMSSSSESSLQDRSDFGHEPSARRLACRTTPHLARFVLSRPI